MSKKLLPLLKTAPAVFAVGNSYQITVNDMTVLELGDGFRAGDWMFPHYSMDTVLCDILLIAHHFNNDELISFYIDYVKKSGQLYALNAHVGATYTGSRGVLANNFNASKNQYLITARFDTIYAFNKKSGVVTMTTHTALYSQNGGSEINNLK